MSNVVLLGISLITLSFESKSVYREEFIRPLVRVSLQFCYPVSISTAGGGIGLD